MLRPRLWLTLTLLLLAAPGPLARADFFSSSPGPLTRAHAKIDGPDHCQDCHVGARDLSNTKCLACHKPIGERQRAHQGFHASEKAAGRQCQLCHTDHKGRNKSILGWQAVGGKERFDHSLYTNFPLTGAHQTTACEKCHTQKTDSGTTTYLTAPTACASCHQNPHGDVQDRFRRCERCHDARNWKMIAHAKFDHNRETRYPIEKKHASVACVSCHARRANDRPPNAATITKNPPRKTPDGYDKLTFRWPTWSTDCQPCHDNVHGKQLFGQQACKHCHSARVDWTVISFDHNRRTRFPLEGAHRDPHKATCASCHGKDQVKPPNRRCETCHVDVHKGRFAKIENNDCAACHTANNWATDIVFDHSTTRFPLTGAHANADCRACHRGKTPTQWEHFENLIVKKPGFGNQVQCMGCHQHTNVHNRQYRNNQCLNCHQMAGVLSTKPRAVAEFHGPNSRFPLTEGHKNVACIKCHPNNVFTKTPLQCGPACHPDDLHKGTLGSDCLECHTGGYWLARRFNHDTKTHFPLVGYHKQVLCEQCHPRRDFANNRGKGVTCYNCHAQDDAHMGALGRHCEKCHNPDGRVLFNHNDPKLSDWPLIGKHERVRCAECHTSIRFKPTPTDCAPCHAEPAVHKGELGTLCAVCHDAYDWKNIHTGHDVPVPRFGGAHDRVPCVKCHTQGKLLAGTGNLCITCHRNDDIHHNGLGPECGKCHTQTTWAGAHFEHERVGCDLTGVHRFLPCVDCHLGGNFVAIAPNCAACHRKDAIRGATAPGAPAGHDKLPTCSPCHNPNFFGPMGRSQGIFAVGRESVCR